MNSKHTIDEEDYKRLMVAILRQAMDDYVKLQHPSRRKRHYEQEAFWSAKDMLFDPDYTMSFNSTLGEPMTLKDLLKVSADRDNIDVSKMHKYLAKAAREYWRDWNLPKIQIPTTLIVAGYVYEVLHNPSEDSYQIDRTKCTLTLNRDSKDAERNLMRAIGDLCSSHLNLKAPQDYGEAFYECLRINDWFKKP